MRRYAIVKNWDEFLSGETVKCRFVYDVKEGALLSIQIQEGNKWRAAEEHEREDIEFSAEWDQSFPHDWGLPSSNALPKWAVTTLTPEKHSSVLEESKKTMHSAGVPLGLHAQSDLTKVICPEQSVSRASVPVAKLQEDRQMSFSLTE